MLRDPKQVYGRVYIVSAYAGVTNELLEHKKTGEPGIYAKFAAGGDYHGALEALLGKLKADQRGLRAARARRGGRRRLPRQADAGAAGLPGLDAPRARERLPPARQRAARRPRDARRHRRGPQRLQQRGHPEGARGSRRSCSTSPASTTTTRSPSTSASTSPSRAWTWPGRWWWSPATPRASRASCGSSTAATPRSPSARWRSSSRPDEAVIHKEFHLSSADPEIVGAKNTVVVGMTNYDVADQLADVGMEAIHPKAAKPMELAAIPLRLKNTFEPDHPGTLITKDYVGKKARIEVIAGSPKVTAVEIHDPSMVGTVGLRPRRDGGLRAPRRLLHPQGHQRELDHPRGLGQVGRRRPSSRSSRTPTRLVTVVPVGHGLRHRLQHRHPRRAGPRRPGAGRATRST